MVRLLLVFALISSGVSFALANSCERAICRSEMRLPFSTVLTFDDQPSGMGPGRQIVGLLALDGASFGERFAGQTFTRNEDFDAVSGPGSAPLQLLPGVEGQNLSILRMIGTNVLSGNGPIGFPETAATGEGSVAIMFAQDQSALRLILRGGEGGSVHIIFLDRDGAILDQHRIDDLGESSFSFFRANGAADIAGVVVSNEDPEGIALDEVAFGLASQSS